MLSLATAASAQTPAPKAAEEALFACLRSASERHPSIARGRSLAMPRLLAFCRVEENAYQEECQRAGRERFACWTNAQSFASGILFGAR